MMKLTRENSTFEERLEYKKEQYKQDYIFYDNLYKKILKYGCKRRGILKHILKHRNIIEKRYYILI